MTRRTARAETLAVMGGSDRFKQAITDRQTAAIERYRRDPFAHLDDGHIMVYDVETEQEVTFEAWPHQRELIAEYVDLPYLQETGICRFRNVHEEKSRQMGITWILAYVSMWAITWHPVRGFMTHLREGDVDDGGSNSTPDSFFGKIRFMAQHENWPDYLRPMLEFTFKRIVNPKIPGAFLRGSTASENAGRGGRFTFAVIDEAARIRDDSGVHASLTRACPHGRFYNSTPEGEENIYFYLRDVRPKGYTFLRHHWSVHPVYGAGKHLAGDLEGCGPCQGVRDGVLWEAENPRTHRYPAKLTSPWYDEAVIELTDEQVAAELDIDYAGSLEARIWHEFSEDVHVAPARIPFDNRLQLHFGMDFGLAAYTSVVFFQQTAKTVRVIAEFEQADLLPEEDSEGMLDALRRVGTPPEILTPEFRHLIQGVGDPAGHAREKGSGRSLIDQYRSLGWSISAQPSKISTTITAGKRLLQGYPKRLLISPGCTRFIRHMKQNRWPVDREGRVRPGATEPQNDQHNHMMSAYRYYANYMFPPPDTSMTVHRAIGRAREKDGSGKLDPSLHYNMVF